MFNKFDCFFINTLKLVYFMIIAMQVISHEFSDFVYNDLGIHFVG